MPTEEDPIAPAYLGAAEADELAALLPGLGAWAAADAAAKAAALLQASADVDAAMPYQGRPYAAGQARQFPRVPDDPSPGADGAPAPGVGVVWNWDDAANEAVVPRGVRAAVLYQADAILAGTRDARLDAQHDGVVYELTGALAESYKRTTGPGVTSGLCRRAWVLMRRFRLRSGRLL